MILRISNRNLSVTVSAFSPYTVFPTNEYGFTRKNEHRRVSGGRYTYPFIRCLPILAGIVSSVRGESTALCSRGNVGQNESVGRRVFNRVQRTFQNCRHRPTFSRKNVFIRTPVDVSPSLPCSLACVSRRVHSTFFRFLLLPSQPSTTFRRCLSLVSAIHTFFVVPLTAPSPIRSFLLASFDRHFFRFSLLQLRAIGFSTLSQH